MGRGRRSRKLGYRAWWDLPALPKLNTDHPQVREYAVVGRRALAAVRDRRLAARRARRRSTTQPFWQEFRRRCRAVNPDAYLVGEIWHVAPEWVAGDRFDALMNYPLLEAILVVRRAGRRSTTALVGRPPRAGSLHVGPIDAAGVRASACWTCSARTGRRPNAAQLNLLSIHDMPRFRSLVSRRPRGGPHSPSLLQMTLPGAPCVYYGDEIGLEGGNDPDCRRSFPAGAAGRDEDLRATVREPHRRAPASHPALRSDRVAVVGAAGAAILLAAAAPTTRPPAARRCSSGSTPGTDVA